MKNARFDRERIRRNSSPTADVVNGKRIRAKTSNRFRVKGFSNLAPPLQKKPNKNEREPSHPKKKRVIALRILPHG
jgi:hypothetical protein